jgi:hypothetical protein
MNKTAQKQYVAAQTGAPLASLSESFLRFETLLSTQNKISFNVKENQGTIIATENRLSLNDAFIITHMALFVKKVASATPTVVQHANAVLYPYRNPSVFDGTNDANIDGLYNSTLSLAVNNVTYIPAMNTFSFKRVPNAQQGNINAAIAGPVTYTTATDERPNSLFGYVETDLIVLTGSQNINIDIDLPTGWSGTFAESSESNYAVLMVAGYLAQNQGTFSAK